MLAVVLITAFAVAGGTVGMVLLLAFRGYRLATRRALEAERLTRAALNAAGVAEGLLRGLAADPDLPARIVTQLELAMIEVTRPADDVRRAVEGKVLA